MKREEEEKKIFLYFNLANFNVPLFKSRKSSLYLRGRERERETATTKTIKVISSRFNQFYQSINLTRTS